MLVAHIERLEPVDYRAAFPNTSFGLNGPSDEFLAEQGYAKVNVFREHNRKTQKLVPCAPIYEAPWVYTVAVENKTAEELQEQDNAKAAEVRADRDVRLAETDWIVIKSLENGSPIPAEWATYRQALRDVPEQIGFPWNVIWPEKP